MIKTVTITGADDSVTPQDIATLSMDFPFVEWAILFSKSQKSGRRFPSMAWVKELIELKQMFPHQIKLSMHLCGEYVREFLKGDVSFVKNELFAVWATFDRCQINTHGESHTINPYFAKVILNELKYNKPKEFIFQYDNVNTFMLDMAVENKLNCSALFDLSHGAGVLPSEWPDLLPGIKCGYAGGISPDNISEQCERINEKVGNVDTWIDMETHVRSNNDKTFDLGKVYKCLSIARTFIE